MEHMTPCIMLRPLCCDSTLGRTSQEQLAPSQLGAACWRRVPGVALTCMRLLQGGTGAARLAALEAVLLQDAAAAAPGSGAAAGDQQPGPEPPPGAIGTGWGCSACGRSCGWATDVEGGSAAASLVGAQRCDVCGLRAARLVPPTLLPEVGL